MRGWNIHMETMSINSRLLKVLSKASSKEFNELEEFAKYLGVSTRTIRNYIKEINSIIVTHKIGEIVHIKELGYKIVIYDQKEFDNLMNHKDEYGCLNHPDERLKYIIEVLINAKEIIKIDELAFELNIGRTTLINDLKKAENLLKLYDVKIKGKPNTGIWLEGNEVNIRLFILCNLCPAFIESLLANNPTTFISKEYYNEVRLKLNELIIFNKLHINDETISNIINYVMVMLFRTIQGRTIDYLEDRYENIKMCKEYEFSLEIIELLSDRINIKYKENEAIYLTLPLIGRKAAVNINDQAISSSMQSLAEEIIDSINDSFGIRMNHDSQIIEKFIYHLNFMLNRLKFNLKIKNDLILDIKNNYPLAYEMATLAGKVIESNVGLKPGEDEVGYMALYFGSYIEQYRYWQESIKKVALVCGTGLGSAQLLNIKLKKYLGKDALVHCYSDMQLNSELLDEYDVIFTTVNIKVETKKPIIKVDILFSEDEFKNAVQEKLIYSKYNLNDFSIKNSILTIMMQKNHFFILDKETYLDNLEFMVDGLYEMGDIDGGFKKRIMRRELKASTSFGNYIALPHAVNYIGDRIQIVLGIIKELVVWNDEEIKLIILLLIPREEHIDNELLVKTYEELLKIAQDRQRVINLSKTLDYDEFMKILIKEGC